MRTFRILLFLLLGVAPSLCLGGSFGLRGMKWPNDTGMQDVRLGREEVQNVLRPQVETGLEAVTEEWVSNFVMGNNIHFNLVDFGSVEYPDTNADGISTVSWYYDPDCSIGYGMPHWGEAGHRVPWRISEFDIGMNVGGGSCASDYCWADCEQPEGTCTTDYGYDYKYIFRHEMGHALGLLHYTPHNDAESILILPRFRGHAVKQLGPAARTRLG